MTPDVKLKFLTSFRDELLENKVLCREDIISLEQNIEYNLITQDNNINSFTDLQTGVGYDVVIRRLNEEIDNIVGVTPITDPYGKLLNKMLDFRSKVYSTTELIYGIINNIRYRDELFRECIKDKSARYIYVENNLVDITELDVLYGFKTYPDYVRNLVSKISKNENASNVLLSNLPRDIQQDNLMSLINGLLSVETDEQGNFSIVEQTNYFRICDLPTIVSKLELLASNAELIISCIDRYMKNDDLVDGLVGDKDVISVLTQYERYLSMFNYNDKHVLNILLTIFS